MTLKVSQCETCGSTLFPSRYFCPACGGSEWSERVVLDGTVGESTVVRHRVGADDVREVYLASVITSAGPVVVARLDQPLESGSAVRLEMDGENRILAHAS